MTEAPPDKRRQATVLIVDDEPDICTSLSLLMRMSNYRAITAGHALMALDLLNETTPDLIISDYMMPWINGRAFLQKVRERESTSKVPTILMSAVDPGEPRAWDAYLRKPADVEELLQTVKRLLSERPHE